MSGGEDRRLLAAIERMELIKTFGLRVRALREEQGISSEDLARRCRIDPSVLSRIEETSWYALKISPSSRPRDSTMYW